MIYQIPLCFLIVVIKLLFIKIDTEQYKSLCLYDISLISVKRTSGNILTVQQGTGILLASDTKQTLMKIHTDLLPDIFQSLRITKQ